ncbi:programmed cell death protein 5 [Nematocida sp. AWRm77]|nr:programmed cell death protein 5 [Nematocida sp. AWRm77]
MNPTESMQEASEKKEVGERISDVISYLLSKESFERLQNIKMVDMERYYQIEKILLDVYRRGAQSIDSAQFLSILQSTEKKKSTIIYSRRASTLDLDD